MAATHGMFIGWNRPKSGHEAQAIETFQSVIAYLGKQQQHGAIESFEPAFLGPHGGDLNGFVLVRGDRARLDTLRWSDEFLDLTTRANIFVDGFGVLPLVLGAEIAAQMQRFAKHAGA